MTHIADRDLVDLQIRQKKAVIYRSMFFKRGACSPGSAQQCPQGCEVSQDK